MEIQNRVHFFIHNNNIKNQVEVKRGKRTEYSISTHWAQKMPRDARMKWRGLRSPVTSQVSEIEEGVEKKKEGRRKDERYVDNVTLCSLWFTPARI